MHDSHEWGGRIMRVLYGIAVAALAGCAPGNPLPPISLSPEQNVSVEDAVRRSLKDPYSARFEGLKAGRNASGSMLVCGYVNAKNGFGGYHGRRMFAARVSPTGLATLEPMSSEAYVMGLCHRHDLTPA